jgi:preprotein translocase SecE subunit
MALGIYKPGQGYWVRVLTATMIGVVTLAAAAWLWSQMAVVAASLPHVRWTLSLGEITGTPPTVGSTVSLAGQSPRSGAAGPSLGTAVVQGYDAASQTLRVGSFAPGGEGLDPTQAKQVLVGGQADAAAGFGAIVRDTSAAAAIQPVLLQGIVASIVILIGAVLAYWFCAIKEKSCEFLIATGMEMKKVNWSTPQAIIAQTWVVIAAAVLIAGALFVVDIVFQRFFQEIGILVRGG